MLVTVGVRVGLPALGRFVLDSSRPHAMLTIGARTGHALGLVSAGFPIVSEPGDRDRFVPWLRDLLCQHW